MYQDLVIAGFGGQGVLLIGNLLAQAGMECGYEVSYIPVYGAEMRGGTANCTVVISDELIGSPNVRNPLAVIAMNGPSLDKFQPRLAPNGVQIVNSSLISNDLVDPSKKSVLIPMNEIAEANGGAKVVNMVALGAFLKATNCLKLSDVQKALEQTISKHYAKLIAINAEALEIGYNYK